MSFDAITGIAQAENAAKVAVSFAEAQARQMLADAEAAGKEAVDEALKKAGKDLELLARQSEIKLENDTAAASGKMETRKAVLRAAAESRMDKAASLIVDRVLSGVRC